MTLREKMALDSLAISRTDHAGELVTYYPVTGSPRSIQVVVERLDRVQDGNTGLSHLTGTVYIPYDATLGTVEMADGDELDLAMREGTVSTWQFPSALTIIGALGGRPGGNYYPAVGGGHGEGYLTKQGTKLGLYFVTSAGGDAGVAYTQKEYHGDYIDGWDAWTPALQVGPVVGEPSEDQTDTPGFLHVPGLAEPYLLHHQVDPGDRPAGQGGSRSGIQIATSADVDPAARTWTRFNSTYSAQQGGEPWTTAFIESIEAEVNQWKGGFSESTAVYDGTNVQLFARSLWRPAGAAWPLLAGASGYFKWVLAKLTSAGSDVTGEYALDTIPVFDPEFDIPVGTWGQGRGDVIHPHVLHDPTNELLHLFVTRSHEIGHFVSPAPAGNPAVWGIRGTWTPNPANPLLTGPTITASGYHPTEITNVLAPFAWIDTVAEKLVVGCHVNNTGAGGANTSFILAEVAWPQASLAIQRARITEIIAQDPGGWLVEVRA